MSNKVKEKRFSLLEMMIVTTIIGILVGVSMIIMQDYVVKARVSEGLVMISPIKNLVVENAYHGMPQLNTCLHQQHQPKMSQTYRLMRLALSL